MKKLQREGILVPVKDSTAASLSASTRGVTIKGGLELFFQMTSVLLRKVGAEMVLEEQRKKVKRQALMDRVLARELPARMEKLKKKKAEIHIPWYYECVLDYI